MGEACHFAEDRMSGGIGTRTLLAEGKHVAGEMIGKRRLTDAFRPDHEPGVMQSAARQGFAEFGARRVVTEQTVNLARSGKSFEAIGLVDRVVPADQVYAEAVAWAQQFAGAASYAVRAAKESIDRGLEVDLETGLEIERQQFAALFATEDRTIGMQSFVENGPGKARFEGR